MIMYPLERVCLCLQQHFDDVAKLVPCSMVQRVAIVANGAVVDLADCVRMLQQNLHSVDVVVPNCHHERIPICWRTPRKLVGPHLWVAPNIGGRLQTLCGWHHICGWHPDCAFLLPQGGHCFALDCTFVVESSRRMFCHVLFF